MLSTKPSSGYAKIAALITMRGLLLQEQDFLHSPRNLADFLKVSHTKYIGKKTYIKEMPLYRRIIFGTTPYYLVARFSLRELPEIVYKNKQHPGENIPEEKYQPGISLMPNQQIAFDYLTENVFSATQARRGFAGCVFVMGTGLGKTFVGGALMEFCAKKTLIVVPGMNAVPEWTSMLHTHYPLLDVGEYHSQTTKSDGDVVIMTIDSAISDQFTWKDPRTKKPIVLPYQKYFERFGMIIYDEVHNYPTERRQEIFWRANFRYTLGLTATPDERADGMDAVVPAHVGPIIRATDIDGFAVEEIKWKGIVRAIHYEGPEEYTRAHKNREGWTDTQKMCEQFIADPYRNALLLAEVETLYRAGKHIFVFSERREYLKTLRQALISRNLFSTMPEDSQNNTDISEAQTLMGGATPEDKQRAVDRARIILITYGYGIESLSIAKMDALVFATPRRRKMRQTLGRILRRNGNIEIVREIVDIIDENTSLKSQFSSRRKIYQEKGFPVQDRSVNYATLSELL
jgi:superfamily II DNA or RNA helicase